MHRLGKIISLIALPACFATCEDPLPTPKPVHVKVYSIESGVRPPTLLPLNLPIPSGDKCKKKVDGKVELSLLVDNEGHARNITFVRPLGTDVDRFALQIAEADKFSPGSSDGNPVVFAAHLRISIDSCLVESENASGKATYTLHLRSNPEQELTPASDAPDDAVLISGPFNYDDIDVESIKRKVTEGPNKPGGPVAHAPVPLIQPIAEYTEDARKARINGTCLISLIVDPEGMPRNLHVQKSLDPGLDQNALVAVSRYRFKPAIRDGEPIPVIVTIEVSFKI